MNPYPSPEDAEREIDALAAAYPAACRIEEIGRSSQGRPIRVLRIEAASGSAQRPRLLVTAQIHAAEFVGSFVARGVARRLLEGRERDRTIAAFLDAADVLVAPLLNPDGAARVWSRCGWSRIAGARHTANGVDPNRNFPGVAIAGHRAWNAARTRPGSAYYRGPAPLSEPECDALARLCLRERFCAAVNFHSFGRVVFVPEALGPDRERAEHVLGVFRGVFQQHQRRWRYRPVPDGAHKTFGQLDAFLLYGLGTPSVTIEVSRPGLALLWPPWRVANVFWWANPARPERDHDNDVDATLAALAELLVRSGGRPCVPAHPEIVRHLARSSACEAACGGA